MRCTFAVIALALCLVLAPAISMAGPLEDMPTVDEVAQAVREQNRLDAPAYRASDGFRSVNGLAQGPRRIQADDLEWYAARLAGTLETLRWFLMLEALREVNDPVPDRWMPLRRPKRSTIEHAEKIAREYREVELALWRGVGKRPGYTIRLCDAPDTFRNRLGGKMVVGQECYLEQFHLSSDIQHIAAYRETLFPRLFCDKGLEYEARYRQYYNDSSHRYPKPRPWDRPHNYVYRRINLENWPVIAQPKTNDEVCTEHGGDKDDNGVCDAWQAALRNPVTDAAKADKCAMCPDPGPAGIPPYRSIVSAAWDASREAIAFTRNEKVEWGGYIYPVRGGYRYLAPVTSRHPTCLDFNADAEPAFSRLFQKGKPASCRHVATFHTHPDPKVVEGLSLGDLRSSLNAGLPYFVMKIDNTKVLHVFTPGESQRADETIRDAVEDKTVNQQQAIGGSTGNLCPVVPVATQSGHLTWVQHWERIREVGWEDLVSGFRTASNQPGLFTNMEEWYLNRRFVGHLTEESTP